LLLQSYCSQEEITNRVQRLTSNGYRIEIHVIGDEAADVALTAIETVNVSPEKRPILIHCQVMMELHYLKKNQNFIDFLCSSKASSPFTVTAPVQVNTSLHPSDWIDRICM
jgi:hypothetical protein